MNARRISKSDQSTFKSLIGNTPRGQRLLFVTLVSVAILCFAVARFAYSQGPIDQVVSEHALGNSPFAEQLSGEEPITVTGILTVLHGDDFANKRSENFYYLKDSKTKETYKLRFNKKAPDHLRSGTTVKARGRAKGRELYLAVDESGQESIEILLPVKVVVAGEQKTLVMVVNFKDVNVSCSVDEIQDLMFTDPFYTSIDDFYQETSFGEVWFSGDVAGPYTIDYTSAGKCDVYAWAWAVENAAQAEGIDVRAYGRKVYVLPKENPCSFAGFASLGGNPSRAWISYCDAEDVFAHELGHSLGMHHAATPSSEYGDGSDIMGYAGVGLRQVNAPHREQMGWHAPDQSVTATKSGIYEIAPLELDRQQALAPQILKIAKPDTNEYYYLSYRRPIGFDNNLRSSYLDGLNVHRYRGSGAIQTYFLDTLLDGESFVDTVNGITITQISHSDAYVTIQVQMDATCVTSAPIADISPASQNAAPGTTLNYSVTVSNTDSANCTARSFELTTALPAGWTGSISPDTLTLSPDQSGTAPLSVTSPSGAAPASYGFTVNVSGAAPIGASYAVEGIAEPDTEAPIAPSGLFAKARGKHVNLSWNAATDNVGIIGYVVWRDGVRIGDTADTGYVDSSISSGMTCIYTVSAYDAAGNMSGPSSSFTLDIAAKLNQGKGKGKPK